MRFSVLGPVQVTRGGSPLNLGGWKQRAVLAVLLQAANETMRLDRIITDIWGGDASPKSRDAVYTYVSNLRRLIGKERIGHGPNGYRLVLESDELDAVQFESSCEGAERLMASAPDRAGQLFEDALSLWRGRAYEGHEDLPTIAPEANRLEEVRTSCRENRFEAQLKAGDTPELAEIEALCGEHPFREKPWSLLMRAEYRAGRQADALRTYQRLCRLLARDLGIEPSPALVRLEERILLQDPTLEATRLIPTNLPGPLTSFVGRVEEQAQLAEAIHRHRFVTVFGPGGSGKTRLAVETARTLLNAFPDGVWMVDLARVREKPEVFQALAAGLGFAASSSGGQDGLSDWMAGRILLILFDNCEHVSDEVGRLAQLVLERASGVKVLATSRVALNRPGEHRIPLLGLGVDPRQGADAEAMDLFVDRSDAVRGHARPLSSGEFESAAEVCRALEGLPLAIELAASRTDVISVAEMADHLRSDIGLLVAEHSARDIHRSLSATIAWSSSLLDDEQRGRFRSLGVFEGPFTAEAAGSVFGGMNRVEVIADLKQLSDASLVVARPSEEAPTYYRLLVPVRTFARAELIDAGVWEETTARHDGHYLDLCRSTRRQLFGTGRSGIVRLVAAELAEYLAAWDRIEAIEPASALPFVWTLGHHWLSGQVTSGYARMAALIESTGQEESVEFADALTIGSWVGMYTNDWERAVPWADQAIPIYEEAGDELGLAFAHTRRGHWAFGRGDIPTAMESLSTSLKVCDRIGFEEGKAWPLVLMGQARRWGDDDSEQVHRMVLEAMETFAAVGDPFGQVHAGMILATFFDRPLDERLEVARHMVQVAERHGGDNLLRPTAYYTLANMTWDDGQHERAEGLNRVCVRSALASGNLITLGLGLMQGAKFAGLERDARRCALLNGAGRAHFAFEVAPFQVRYEADAVAAAKDLLGERDYDRLFAEGGNLSPEDAAALILQPTQTLSPTS
jgi:predicted ATPase/DNA-binding SARP family transcriptional activator